MHRLLSPARRFRHFELQPSERVLLTGGPPIALGPRAFELSVALTERPRQLLRKEELLARVWPRVVVEENALQVQVSALRKPLGPKSIKTVSKGGYRFELDVVELPTSTPEGNGRHHLPCLNTTFIGRQIPQASSDARSDRWHVGVVRGGAFGPAFDEAWNHGRTIELGASIELPALPPVDARHRDA